MSAPDGEFTKATCNTADGTCEKRRRYECVMIGLLHAAYGTAAAAGALVTVEEAADAVA